MYKYSVHQVLEIWLTVFCKCWKNNTPNKHILCVCWLGDILEHFTAVTEQVKCQ